MMSRPQLSLVTGLALALSFAVPAALAQTTIPLAPGTAPGGAQPAQPQPVTATPSPTEPAMARLTLGGGDLVEVSIYGVPDLTSKGRISGEGELYLPLIGYQKLAGLTPEDAQAVIEQKYVEGGFLKNPHVTLNVLEYVTQGASLLGEVARPGIYPVLGSRRLFDVISAAGGFTQAAGRTVTITHRSEPEDPHVVTFANSADKATEANVEIFPGDTIVVSRAPVIYVVGEVHQPAGILMQNPGMTVLKALALGGGPTERAKLDNAKIIRRAGNKTQEIPVPLKQILSARAKDLELFPDDVLFVPGKNVMAIQTVLSIVSGLALRAPIY